LKLFALPIISCFVDPDPKVRYFACEALYNICKVVRANILDYFNDIFDSLSKLVADPDQTVKIAAELLDRLMKDIVTENGRFDVEKFIPLLSERIYVKNPFVRQFLVSWISVLNTVPDIDLLSFLPAFLDGLFGFLSDQNKDIHVQTSNVLAEFLREIKQAEQVEYQKIAEILIKHINSRDPATQKTALIWVNEFILLARELMLPYTSDFLGAILPALSYQNPEKESAEKSSSEKQTVIKAVSAEADANLMNLVLATEKEIDYVSTVSVLTKQLANLYEETRMAALEWLIMLHKKAPKKVFSVNDEIFPVMLKTLSDQSENVVRLDLELLAQISAVSEEAYFRNLLINLLKLFSTDRALLESRGSLIIRQLCLALTPEYIYRMLAEVLEKEEDLDFASLMIHNLNLILLTATELVDLRKSLKNLHNNETAQKFFVSLYRSWSHNAVGTFSLCLLAQVYQHACDLVNVYADMEMTVAFLVDVDKLVQLLESPIFAYLRLQLLEPDVHPYLFKCLYGILMLLPQSGAFVTLRNRLNSVSSMGILNLMSKEKQKVQNLGILDFDALLLHFTNVQQAHQDYRKKALQVYKSLRPMKKALREKELKDVKDVKDAKDGTKAVQKEKKITE